MLNPTKLISVNLKVFALPRWTNISGCDANFSDASINEWLKPLVLDGFVVHSFRHSLRDILRRVECP